MRAFLRHRFCPRFFDYCCDRKAAAAVEVALTFPFFALFILIMIEVSLFFFASSAVHQGVFDYSRRLTSMNSKGKIKFHQDGIEKDILEFVGKPLIKSIKFEVGPVTPTTDFRKTLKQNSVQDFVKDKSQPIYLRVVAQRQNFTYGMFKYVWNAICDPKNGGLFSEIDVLVVIPWPPRE